MRVLILGGTIFLGRHLVDAALALGHQVTLFNRGQSHPHLYPKAQYPDLEQLRGDRDGGLDALRGRTWDTVIDTCGYIPRLVSDAARRLADAVAHYTFISSLSVYDDFTVAGIRETAAVRAIDDETVEDVTGDTYGPLKALCEQAAEAAMPGRVLNMRAGLLIGPYDPTDRFTYWVARVARSGDVLAPPSPAAQVQFIDARDAAAWVMRMAAQRRAGTYNVTGPAARLTFAHFLESCRAATGSDARFHWAAADFLAGRAVLPWIDLPLWVRDGSRGLLQVDIAKAVQAGLTFRALTETIADTLAWTSARPDTYAWQAGLTPTREAELLAAWCPLMRCTEGPHAEYNPLSRNC